MNLETKKFKFEILTPCFSGTALEKFADNAEIRVPPIRGNIRLWHNILLGNDNVKRVWGLAEKGNTSASKVGVNLINTQCEIDKELILPHKGESRGKSYAIMEGGIVEFELVRLIGCTDIDWKNAEMATKLWLLLGGMGARANRAAGSVWPLNDWAPKDEVSFYNYLKELGLKNYSLVLISNNRSSEDLRTIASDTKENYDVFGCARPRKPSPVKFKVIKLNSSCYLLAHSKQREKLEKAFDLLKNKSSWRDFGDWSKNIKTF